MGSEMEPELVMELEVVLELGSSLVLERDP
jgi:hypothetical protein